MNRQEIEKKVNDILVDKLGVDYDEVKNEAKFEDDLGGDSLDCVELIIEFEHEFGISIKDGAISIDKSVMGERTHIKILLYCILGAYASADFTKKISCFNYSFNSFNIWKISALCTLQINYMDILCTLIYESLCNF